MTNGPEPPAGMRGRKWRRFLKGPDPALLNELYIPALSEGIKYDRCCAYFSSSVLAAAARGFGNFIKRLEEMGDAAPRPAIRLVVNEELSEEDVRALTETSNCAALEEQLLRRFLDPVGLLTKKRLEMLGWLVKVGLLEVRVGVMRKGGGIVHAKFGVVTDNAGDAVVFSGSGNETARGLLGNFERLEVSTSWEDPERYNEYSSEFEALWQDKHADVMTVTLPDALERKLISFAPAEPPMHEPMDTPARHKAAMLWQYIVEAPYLPNGASASDATAMVDSWPHQRHVVEEVSAAWPDGRLLCDEVGMGKTIEAILILRRLLYGRGVKRVLILVPAGLLKQWQGELREKGGLIVPRYEGQLGLLVWPDGTSRPVEGLSEALGQDILLLSRETARTEGNVPLLLQDAPWDLVILDESHHARRRKQVEGEFNSGTLLLDLLRKLQLKRQVRGFMLLSATPMQTHPWEPWDLLTVLGEGGAWFSEFGLVRDYYDGMSAVRAGMCDPLTAKSMASLIAGDPLFPPYPGEGNGEKIASGVAAKILHTPALKRDELLRWLRCGSPLMRRMHRNTRSTLRRYYELGLLSSPPPNRTVTDLEFDFLLYDERRVYEDVARYIEKRYAELEEERGGKGFVMTIYRRRASSSPLALRRSLERRKDGLQRVIAKKAYAFAVDASDMPQYAAEDDLPDDDDGGKVSSALPEDPQVAQNELREVDRLLTQMGEIGATDSKRDKFYSALSSVLNDGRSVLVFTEYTDTMEYLRESLIGHYGGALGCYSGDGGQRWTGTNWKTVSKDEITRALMDGELRVLLCTDAASEGLNLQAASALINYDLPWNPSRIEQRIGRVDRIGQQQSSILVINMFLHNSVDERVYRALRARCGLFEHFVGPMQPVLASAKKMLLGRETIDIDMLQQLAEEVQSNSLINEAYADNEAQPDLGSAALLTRKELEQALLVLDGSFGPTVVPSSDGVYELSLDGQTIRLSSRAELLDRDETVRPLHPAEPTLRQLLHSLSAPGEALPLVIGSHHNGGFRASVAYWVAKEEAYEIDSFGDLKRRIEEWEGTYPSSEMYVAALAQARDAAQRRVGEMQQAATERESQAIARQISAARIRLQRELGRYLVCMAGSADDLNGEFYRLMSRDIEGKSRIRECYERFGSYPEWSLEHCQELDSFYSSLSESQRNARMMGSELDAALGDPRWMAHDKS